VEVLESAGWPTTVSDLYAMGFDPCERHEHYEDRDNPLRFDVQAEQFAPAYPQLPGGARPGCGRLDQGVDGAHADVFKSDDH
jgi:NAD(P)H dehydrogenase (quinone)